MRGGWQRLGNRLKPAALACLGGMALFTFLCLIDVYPDETGPLAWTFLALAAALIAAHILFFQRVLFAFLARRAGLMVVSFIGITILTFTIVRLAPGDPVSIQMGPGGDATGSSIDTSKLTRDPGQAIRERLHMLVKHRFTAHPTDPDGDPVRVVFTWGDGTPEGISESAAPGGAEQSLEHYFANEGDYKVQVRAVDPHGFESEPSEPVAIRIRERYPPPDRPVRPQGPSKARLGEEIAFSSNAACPDGGPVSLLFDWGDGILSPPTDPLPSGSRGERKHQFMKSGRFTVQVLAIGKKGALSPWSDPAEALIEDPARPYPRPGRPVGPGFLHVSEEPLFSGRSAVSGEVEIDWDDGSHTRVQSSPDGMYQTRHLFPKEGKYRIRARHVGAGGESDWSDETVVRVSETNHRPDRPAPPRGPSEGKIRTSIVYQYTQWFQDLLRLDFGRSTSENRDVWKMIQERLPRTLFMDIVSFVLIYVIAVPIGIFSSTHRGTLRDSALTASLFLLYSLPTFWVGTMLIVLVTPLTGLPIGNVSCDAPHRHYVEFGSHLFLTILVGIAAFIAFFRWEKTRSRPFVLSLFVAVPFFLLGLFLPVPWASLIPAHAQDRLWHSVLPVAVLTYPSLAALSRYARSGMLEVVRQDYIRTARAKGLHENIVIFKHALRNGMIPILTLMAAILPAMISGSIIVEWIFNVQGMGLMAYDGVTKRDYPVIMAVTTLSAVLTLLGLLFSDILYVLVDPRISFDSKTDE